MSKESKNEVEQEVIEIKDKKGMGGGSQFRYALTFNQALLKDKRQTARGKRMCGILRVSLSEQIHWVGVGEGAVAGRMRVGKGLEKEMTAAEVWAGSAVPAALMKGFTT